MLHIELDALTEEHLQALCDQSAEEGLRLEFKREMDLATPQGKFETAKDVAAMANGAGGRIVYGIEEESHDQGPATAATIVPLTDVGTIERYRDTLYARVFPPPRFRYRRIDLAAGSFALVTEVYSSAGRDLHGVVRGDQVRFWRRGLSRNVSMSEPEIREAYSRIAVSAQQLEDTIEDLVRQELEATAAWHENFVIVPWFARPNLADPRLLTGIGPELANGPLSHLATRLDLLNLRPSWKGLGAEIPDTRFAVNRSGILHLTQSQILLGPKGNAYLPVFTLRRLLGLLFSARLILGRVGYWGPVRILHELNLPDCVMAENDYDAYSFPGGHYRQQLSEVRLDEVGNDLEPVAREIMDQIYQIAGRPRCDWFDGSGHLNEQHRKWVWGSFPVIGAPPGSG